MRYLRHGVQNILLLIYILHVKLNVSYLTNVNFIFYYKLCGGLHYFDNIDFHSCTEI